MSEFTPFIAPSTFGTSFGCDTTMHAALNTDDGDANRLFIHNSGAGQSNAHSVVTNTIPDNVGAIRVTWKAKILTIVGPGAGDTFRIGFTNSLGNTYWGVTHNQTEGTGSYVTYSETIDCTGPGVGGVGGSNLIQIECQSSGNDGYYIWTYMKVETASHTITASSDSHSAFDQEGAITVADAGSLTLTATPSAGYRIQDVLVDGVSVGDAAGSASYVKTFTNVTTDHTISVTSYLYTAPAPGNAQGMTNSGEYVNFVYDFSQAIEAEGLAQVLGPGGQGFPWSSPLILNSGAMVRTWDGNLYGANDANTGATSNGAIYQLDTGLYDTPVKVQGYTTGLNYVTGSLVQSTGVITATAATDFFRVAVGAKITGSGITGTATVTAKSSNGDTITVTGTLTGNTTNQQYTCWGREIEARAVFPCDRFGMMGDEVSGQFATVAYACPTGELIRVQHSYDFSRATMVPMELPATGAANATTHRAPQDRAKVELPSASRTTSQLQEFAVLMYNGSAGTDTLGRSECWGLESTNRILRSYR